MSHDTDRSTATGAYERFPLCGPDAPEERYKVACAGTPVNAWVLSMGTYNCTGGSHQYGMHLVCSCTCHEVKTVSGLYAMHDHSGHAPCTDGCPAHARGDSASRGGER